MPNFLLILIIILVCFVLFFIYYLAKKYKTKKVKKSSKPKKEKPNKKQKIKKDKKTNEVEDALFKGSSVDLDGKFLYRKEIKVLALVNRILPKGYIVFPKVGVDLILSPVGNRYLYDAIRSKYIDLVVFEEATMKPKIAIDLYDGIIGSEQLDIESPEVYKALEVAELPVLEIRVKGSYTEEEIKEPIFKILEIKSKEDNENRDNYKDNYKK